MEESYVIRHKEGGYLYRAANAAWERTVSLQKATKLTYEKAENVLNNAISLVMRGKWEINNINDIELSSNYENTSFDEDGVDWENVSKEQYELYRNLTQYRTNLNLRLSEIDKEICDINHYIEFFSLDAARGYKAYRMLKERLAKRRFIKDELARAGYFMGGTSADFSNGLIARQIKELDNRHYTPRVLTELFGIEYDCKHVSCGA